MALIVPTLPPRRPRQASALAYPRAGQRGRAPIAVSPKANSNTDLWRFYRLPEVRKVANWTGSGVGRVSFGPAVDVPGRTGDLCPPLVAPDGTVADGVPERLARDAQALWSLVRSPLGGQADLWKSLSISLQVAADAWLFAYPSSPDLAYDPDGVQVWVSLAREAIDERAGHYEVDVGTESKVRVPIDDGRPVRVWRQDPRSPAKADSWVTAAQRDLERLEGIYEAVAAVALSRMHAGVILAPDNQDRGRDTAATFDEADTVLGKPLRLELYDQIAEHVEASAAELDGFARAVPPVIALDKDLIESVKWLELAREIDPEMRALTDDLRYRIAIASDSPPETLLGLGDSNHWNDEAVTTAEFQRGVQPDCEVICDATTPHVLRAGLLAMGHAPAEVALVRVGYDPSALVDPPDRSTAAIAVMALPNPPLTMAEARDAMGLAEYAGPDEDAQRLVLVERLVLARPEYGYLLPELGLPAPPEMSAEPTVEPEPEPEPEPAPDLSVPELPAAARVAAAPADDDRGPAMTAVAARYESRLDAIFGAIIDRMVERASSRVASLAHHSSWSSVRGPLLAAPADLRGAVPGVRVLLAADGVDDTDLLGGALAAFAVRFESETTKAQRAAIRATGGDWPTSEPDAEVASAAAWALAGTLLIAEARRRFDGDLPDEGDGEGAAVAAFAVPALLVRRVSALAGGTADVGVAASGAATSALLSIATGPLAIDALARAGQTVTGWVWDWGLEDRPPFEPHLDLNGSFAAETDGFDGWAPGDHRGCLCQLVAVTAAAPATANDEPEEGTL